MHFFYDFKSTCKRTWVGGSMDGYTEHNVGFKMLRPLFVTNALFKDANGHYLLPEHEGIRPYLRDGSGYPRNLRPAHNAEVDDRAELRTRTDRWDSCSMEFYAKTEFPNDDGFYVYTWYHTVPVSRCSGTRKVMGYRDSLANPRCYYPATPGYETCPYHGNIDPDSLTQDELFISSFLRWG